MPGRGQVGRHQPVREPVLERLWHLGCGQQQGAARRQKAGHRRDRSYGAQRAQPEAAQRHHLQELDRGHRGQDEEAKGENAGVDGDQRLTASDRDPQGDERSHSKQGLAKGAWVAGANVGLIPPFLAPVHDLILGRAHELPAGTGRARGRDHHREAHAGANHLAEKRRRPPPPWPTASRLGDREPYPRRCAHQVDPDSSGRHRPRKRVMCLAQ